MFNLGDKVHIYNSLYSIKPLNGEVIEVLEGKYIFPVRVKFENNMTDYFTVNGERTRGLRELYHGHFQQGSKEHLLTVNEMKRILSVFKAIGTDRNLQMKIENELVRVGE